MEEIKITDHHTAESIEHFTIREGDIYMADAGYGKGTTIEYVLGKKADVILRITPNNVRLVDDKGETIDMAKRLATKDSTVEIKCLIKSRSKLLPIRIIASRIPEDKVTVHRGNFKAQLKKNFKKPFTRNQ